MRRRELALLAALGLASCGRPPDAAAPSEASGEASARSASEVTPIAAPTAASEAMDCPPMAVYWRSETLWEDAPAFLAELPVGVYVRAGEDSFDISHLFTGAVDPADAREVDPDTYFDIGYTAQIDAGYRRDGACDRLVVENEIEEDRVEAFLAVRGGALALYDSLGAPLGTLAPVGAPGSSSAGVRALGAAPAPPVRMGASGGPGLVTPRGRVDLAELFPHGRWFARPAGVRFRGSDLVLVNACDPYSEADGFCGFENDGKRPLADPWSPLVTYVAVRTLGGGEAVEVVPFGGGLGGTPFPGLWGEDMPNDARIAQATRTLRVAP